MKTRYRSDEGRLMRLTDFRHWLPRLFFVVVLGLAGTMPALGKSLAEGNSEFAFALYQRLDTNPGNIFFSPYSISTALAMTCAGASGQTEKQMAAVLHFSSNQRQLHSDFSRLQKELKAAGGNRIQINIANALWAEKTHPFLPGFMSLTSDAYDAEIKQADFKSEAGAAINEINGWIARKTQGKIQNILSPRSLDAYTRLVLANAIYFKGRWASPFQMAETDTQPFHLSQARQINVPLMHREDEFKYMESEDFQAIELPYAGGRLAMVILLPRETDGCGLLERRLTQTMLARALDEMKRQTVIVFLPRYKLESTFSLDRMLASMGMPDAFDPIKADFSAMDGTRNLYISAIIHKAWGEVNEEGTEAAAATVVTVMASGIPENPPPPPPIFRADHPFVFLIRDTRSGSILFLGRLANPLSNSEG